MILRRVRVFGTDAHHGDKEVATVVLERSAYGDFLVYHYLNGFDGDRFDPEVYDHLHLAESAYNVRAVTFQDRYDERARALRRFRARDLRDLSDDWADGPDRDLVYRIADAIEMGMSSEELAR